MSTIARHAPTSAAQKTRQRLQKAFKDTLAQWPKVKAQEMKRLDKAGQEGNLFVIKEIITRYPNEAIHWKDEESLLTPLHWAAIGRRGDIAAWLLEQGADITAQDKDNLTPVHYAAQAIDTDALELLLNVKADFETRDKRGNTPLIYAVYHKRAANTHLLVMAGADIHAPNDNRETPHSLSHSQTEPEVAEAMDAAIDTLRRKKSAAEKSARAQKASLIAEAVQTMIEGTSNSLDIKKPIRFKSTPVSP